MAQLRKYYEDNSTRFLTAPSRSFEQVYFSFVGNRTPTDPQAFIQQLKGSANTSELGEFSLLGNRLSRHSFQQTATTFGKPFAQAIFDMPLNHWRGPVESFRGIHYVRVIAEHEPELPPFEEIESYLRTDYIMQKSRESQTSKIDALRENYHVVLEAG